MHSAINQTKDLAPSIVAETGSWRHSSGPRPRVLLGEDNPVNQIVAANLLEELGCEVIPAASGREVIEAFQRARPDLVLMDCQMPELDGYAAAAEIRRLENGGGRVPIVALTAHAFAVERERCLDAGMDDVVTKPIESDSLSRALGRWLANSTAPTSPRAIASGGPPRA